MGKTGKWIKSFLIGGKKDYSKDKDKDKDKCNSNHSSSTALITTTAEKPATPIVIPAPTTPKEKKRWSFRRSSATAPTSKDSTPTKPTTAALEPRYDQDKHAVGPVPPAATPTTATETAEPAQVMAAAPVDHLNPTCENTSAEEDTAAAIKIQSMYRSYLARKALRALRGLVKLQALVRGHLVRKQATATLRCMQALVTAQARARAHRIRSGGEDGKPFHHHRPSTNRRNSHEFKYRHYQEMDKGLEENIKIVEMDHAEFHNSSQTRNSYPNYHTNNDRTDHRLVPNFPPQYDYSVSEYQRISPAPSAITDMSPRTCSGHFEDYTFATAQSSPQCYSIMSRPDPSRNPFTFPRQDYAESLAYDYPLYPNYMANTQSSRAKARSQSAPKQRPDSVERQPSRRRPSIEGRNIPRAVRMQRSSSHVGSAAQNYQYPWAIKLDKSAVSLMESECGSTCSVFTNTNCARSVISYDPQGNRY